MKASTRTLARWLGPWTRPTEIPRGVLTERVPITPDPSLGLAPFEGIVFRPEGRAITGSVLLVPGLHYLGADDPRLDRFARVLARAGYLVLSPLLPSYLRLLVVPRVIDEVNAALDALLAHALRPSGERPGVMSISFGSMPALRLAALRGGEVGSVLVFGGFADFRRTLHFALRGERAPGGGTERAHDPLNAPAVVINLLPFFGEAEGIASDADRLTLHEAMLDFCRATWGRAAMKVGRGYAPVGDRIAEALAPRLRPFFLRACRVEPGIDVLADEALARSGDHFGWIDPRPSFSSIRCPVTLVHGADDDVIPFEESELLERALAPHTEVARYLTGLYGHTHVEGVERSPAALARELASMLRILRAMASLSR